RVLRDDHLRQELDFASSRPARAELRLRQAHFGSRRTERTPELRWIQGPRQGWLLVRRRVRRSAGCGQEWLFQQRAGSPPNLLGRICEQTQSFADVDRRLLYGTGSKTIYVPAWNGA